MVTHGITFLPQTDKIIVLKDGVISEAGSYKELLDKVGDFAEFLLEHLNEEEEGEDIVTGKRIALITKKRDILI